MSRKLDGENFATFMTKRPRFYSDPGSREAEDYEVVIDKKGHKSLKCVGTHDIYDEIQSYKDECLVENIIAKATAGDVNALNQRQGFYADITEMPASLAEAQNAILRLSHEFDTLPTEIKEKFDNSKEVFVHEFGSEEWAEKMGFKSGTPNKAENIETMPGMKEATEVLTPEGE